jgi:hypothetical protein
VSKAARRAAIAAEIARREAKSGVPPELHVYAMRPHYADEGGPRTFFPARRLDTSRGKRESYTDEIRELLARATHYGEPIELEPEREPEPGAIFVKNAPLADFCEVGLLGASFMIFSARAAQTLERFLKACCQPVPLRCSETALVGYLLRAVEDVLDAAHSDGWWNDYKLRTRASDIKRYAFFTERLGRAAIFTVPQHWQTLVLQPFVDAAREAGLNGMRFRKVWPSIGWTTWE